MDKEKLAWVASVIQQAQQNRIFGEVVIKIEGGNITKAYKKETLKPPSDKDSSS